jgi:hypothetical protein
LSTLIIATLTVSILLILNVKERSDGYRISDDPDRGYVITWLQENGDLPYGRDQIVSIGRYTRGWPMAFRTQFAATETKRTFPEWNRWYLLADAIICPVIVVGIVFCFEIGGNRHSVSRFWHSVSRFLTLRLRRKSRDDK